MMNRSSRKLALGVAVAAALAAPSAFATNGYFSHGFGIKSQGMGGAGVAFSQDALAAATNPAGMVLVGSRMDVGASWFRPIRDTSVTGNAAPSNNISYDASEKKDFLIPEFGYNTMLDSNRSFGVSIYGNGGMNTSYTRNVTLFGTSNAGVDLMQLFIAPTMAWKLSDTSSVGVSLNLAYQRFKATGLQNFDNTTYSSSPGNVTDRGYDSATGWGLRVGWVGQLSPSVTMGATYQSKTDMSKFDKYKGLFAEQGNFDIPSNYALGIAIKASPTTTVAIDVEKIKYSDSKAVSNPIDNLFAGSSGALGADGGGGFGWKDMTVIKLGVSHQISSDLTVRAGWNRGKQPIPNSQTLFNMLAPGVVEDHVTVGATWKLDKNSELSGMFMYALSNEVKGSGSIPSAFGSGEANLKMKQTSIGVSYGKSF